MTSPMRRMLSARCVSALLEQAMFGSHSVLTKTGRQQVGQRMGHRRRETGLWMAIPSWAANQSMNPASKQCDAQSAELARAAMCWAARMQFLRLKPAALVKSRALEMTGDTGLLRWQILKVAFV